MGEIEACYQPVSNENTMRSFDELNPSYRITRRVIVLLFSFTRVLSSVTTPHWLRTWQ